MLTLVLAVSIGSADYNYAGTGKTTRTGATSTRQGKANGGKSTHLHMYTHTTKISPPFPPRTVVVGD
jgi:hypothetical protein